MAYDAQGYWIPNQNADDSSRIYSDEQRALQRQRFEEQLAAMGIPMPMPTEGPSRVRTGDLPPSDMHNPGWGLERPGDVGGKWSMGSPVIDPYRTGMANPNDPTTGQGATWGRYAPGGSAWGTLGGAAGMGQPVSLYERGGGQSAYGGLGMAPQPGPYGTRGGGLGMGRQSPTPYGMGRPSPTPYQGSGYSTLGGMSGYGRQRY